MSIQYAVPVVLKAIREARRLYQSYRAKVSDRTYGSKPERGQRPQCLFKKRTVEVNIAQAIELHFVDTG